MSMQPEKKTIALASGPLEYWVAGSGAPVVHCHPAGGVRWGGVHEALAGRYTVYAPVVPGFDRSADHAAVTTIRDLGKLMGTFIDTVIGDKVHLIGHSFGGWVAAWLAAERLDRVRFLVLECAAGFRPVGAPPTPSDPAVRKKLLFKYPENLGGTHDPALEAANGMRFGKYHSGMARDEALIERLPSIDRTTLVLHGSDDGLIPAAASILLRERLPASFVTYIWDAGHAMEVDQPERVARSVLEFLEHGEKFLVNRGSSAIP
jgi:pimeloyl-ACP methyl ester carboxylesterase